MRGRQPGCPDSRTRAAGTAERSRWGVRDSTETTRIEEDWKNQASYAESDSQKIIKYFKTYPRCAFPRARSEEGKGSQRALTKLAGSALPARPHARPRVGSGSVSAARRSGGLPEPVLLLQIPRPDSWAQRRGVCSAVNTSLAINLPALIREGILPRLLFPFVLLRSRDAGKKPQSPSSVRHSPQTLILIWSKGRQLPAPH